MLRERRSLATRINYGAAALKIPRSVYAEQVEAGKKWCWACHDWHPCAAFGVRRSTPDGLDNICTERNNARAREGMRRLRARRQAERGAT